jgi:amino acid adenylation domain-containing protein
MTNSVKAVTDLSLPEKELLLNRLRQKQAANTPTFPLSFAQERLWFLEQLEPNTAVFNIARAIRLTGELQVPALHQALQSLVARHEALRTSFVEVNGAPMQCLSPTANLALPLIDLRAEPAASRQAEWQRLATAEAQRPFDLSQAPLLRATLLRMADTDHTLLLTVHHLVADGWSLAILFQELTTLYPALAAGQPAPRLPDLPIQYVDFAVWQRDHLNRATLAEQLAYWQQQLANPAASLLNLPFAQSRPAVQTFNGSRQSLSLPAELSQALRTLSRQAGVTLFMTLLAAFKTLLYRYTGQTDLAVGTPVANRNRSEVEGVVGFFVNTLVLRTDLRGNPTFRDLLQRVHQVALAGYAHQDIPFANLVAALQPERDQSHSPLFQVMFTLQSDPMPVVEQAGLGWEVSELTTGTAKFDLSLFVLETEAGLVVTVEYNTDLFDRPTITRLLGHYQNLLSGIVAGRAEARLAALPLLTPAEQEQLLVTWNDTARPFPDTAAIHHLVEAQAGQTPQATAVSWAGHSLTYAELNGRANQLAHHLQQLGVGPEVLVGVCLEPSVELVVALLAVLKAGGAYVPLDPAFPPARLALMLADARPPVLLTQQALLERLPATDGQLVCLDRDWPAIAAAPNQPVVSGVTPENLAYVIYTSGSTGRPKGVQIPHRAVVNFLTSMRQSPGLTATDVLLSVTTLSFDIAVLELFLPLICGAHLVLAGRAEAADGRQLAAQLEQVGATVMQATPATWRLLLESGWAGSRSLKMLCGGEALPRSLADRLLSKGAALWNLYGPTETTIWSTLQAVGPGPGPVVIGRPIANTQLYILDENLQPAPLGVAGELYIGGAGLARGYLNRPALTEERFIPNPFRAGPTDRLYKTGDLARYLPDGSLEVLGRLDHQVKIRGFRIELGEIEAALSHHPDIRQAVVIVRQDGDDKQLVAYVVADQAELATDALRRFLAQKLPDYMLPAAFVRLAAFPLTPNGKIDRLALPALTPSRPVLSEAFVAPANLVETILAKTWSEVLKIEQVGRSDNFFELGGHSLLATQLVSRLRKLFQIEIPLRRFFDRPTVAGLAETLLEYETRPGQVEATARLRKQISEMPADKVRELLRRKSDKG